MYPEPTPSHKRLCARNAGDNLTRESLSTVPELAPVPYFGKLMHHRCYLLTVHSVAELLVRHALIRKIEPTAEVQPPINHNGLHVHPTAAMAAATNPDMGPCVSQRPQPRTLVVTGPLIEALFVHDQTQLERTTVAQPLHEQVRQLPVVEQAGRHHDLTSLADARKQARIPVSDS